MLLTENEQKWQSIIKEELGVTDQVKLNWMSKYAQIHQLHEGLQPNTGTSNGIYSTPLNTIGMGNPMMPLGVGFNPANGTGNGTGIGNTGADFHDANYVNGSGDIPMSTLQMSLQVAAMTIGFELVPVVPANGPWAMLTYFDTPYAGGKLGKINETSFDGKGPGSDNKPIYIKTNATFNWGSPSEKPQLKQGDTVTVVSDNGTLNGTFLGFSRIDNDVIIKVVDCGNASTSIADVFSAEVTVTITGDVTIASTKAKLRPELVSTFADHIQGFSNFFDGSDDPMTRAQNETGVGNTIGARLQSKLVQMGSFEVTGSVTRQQLRDMPLYGIDVVGKILESMQNELSQAINNRILDRVFKLGVTNAEIQKKYQGVDLNLTFDNTNATKNLADFTGASKFVGIDNVNKATDWGAVKVAVANTNYENVMTHQRRISSRALAAANIIAQVSRRGRGNWIVANSQIVTALQDVAGFVVAPMTNTLVQDGSQSLYFAGTLGGMNVYCDPYMLWDDTRVCVGRKASDAQPGVVFMPYVLCDTIQTVVEGTMAPKLLCNSSFALVDAGWYPEQTYFTFLVDGDADII